MNGSMKEAFVQFKIYFANKQYMNALKVLEELISNNQLNTAEELVKCATNYSKVANILTPNKNILKSALSILNKAIISLKSLQKTFSPTIILSYLTTSESLATIYHKSESLQISLNYLKKALSLYKIPQNSPKILLAQSKVELKISSIYLEMERFSESLHFANNSLKNISEEIKKTCKKEICLLLTEEFKKKKKSIVVLVLCYYNIAIAKACLGESKMSNEIFAKAIIYAEGIKEVKPEMLKEIKENYENVIRKRKKVENKLGHTRRATEDIEGHKAFFEFQYYSPDKLKKVSSTINNEQKFISTDQFYLNLIRSSLEINEKSKEFNEVTRHQKQESLERRSLSEIRMRKHHKSQEFLTNQGGLEEKMRNLHKESTFLSQKQSSQLKSKLRTRFYKKLFTTFNGSAKFTVIPPQST